MHPECVRIGNFVIYWYGVLIACAVFVCSIVFQRNAVAAGIRKETASEIVFWTVIVGILSGRAGHVLSHLPYYGRHLAEIVQIRNGGLSVQGAIAGAVLFLSGYAGAKRLSFLKLADLVALVTPLGQAIGRIGCFLNGCCYGKPSGLPWAISIPATGMPGRIHPTELYYSGCDLLIFVFLLLMSRVKQKDGELLGFYLILFGLLRYFLDELRGDLLLTKAGVTMTQILGIGTFLAGALFLWAVLFSRHASHPDNGQADRQFPD